MVDERAGAGDTEYRRSTSWTQLLRTFLVALDPFKLIVAAIGIVATAVGWWLLSVIFWSAWSAPRDTDYAAKPEDAPERKVQLERDYAAAVARYEFMREYAGPGGPDRPGGRMRVMPWDENRGPNPYHFAKGVIAGRPDERREMIDRFTTHQVPTLVEPLRKFLSPVIGLFDARGNFWTRLYLFLALLWFLLVWAFFGGVITRMAILQLAGKEGGGLRESVRFVASRYPSYLFSPLVPIGIILAIVLGCILFGLFHLIPLVGDIFVDGLFWWIPIGAGFVMALLLVGLVGYPLMYTTLSAEGSDTFDALSRSYNYVYESPWSYLWYSLIAILYGAVVIFFVVFMGSLMVYLGKWGVAQTPFTESFGIDRAPHYLFRYVPESFGWRQVMLEGTPIAVDDNGNWRDPARAEQYMADYRWYNHAGAGMVAFWVTLVFLLMLGFAYSYFWSAASMIYLLMRKKVDETEVDEVYIEEEEPEEPVAPPKAPPPPPSGGTQMVEPPSLRVSTPPPSAPPEAAPPAPPSVSTASTAATEMTAPSPTTTETAKPSTPSSTPTAESGDTTPPASPPATKESDTDGSEPKGSKP